VVKGDELINYAIVAVAYPQVSDIKAYRHEAVKFYKEHLQGKKVRHEHLGEILFSRRGLDETLHNSNAEKLTLVPHLEAIITTGKSEGWKELSHPRNDGLVQFALISNMVNMGGQIKHVGVFVAKDRNGNIYYDLVIKKPNGLTQFKEGTRSVSDAIIPEGEYEVNIFIEENAEMAKVNDSLEHLEDKAGFIAFKGRMITKVGVFPYLGRSISPTLVPDQVYNVLRPAEELLSQETIESFQGVPLINDHTMIGPSLILFSLYQYF
jgi:tetrahydromethanopterin S-methyltransferase subunit F